MHHAKYKKSRLGETSPPQPSTSKSAATNDEDSDSSVDDHLVNADNLDLQSPFFATSNNDTSTAVPKFECNMGLRLSDSEDDSNGSEEACPSSDKLLKQSAESKIDFSEHRNLAAKLENAKGQLSQYFRPAKPDAPMDVSKLLALGEVSKNDPKAKKTTAAKRKADSDSDWEDVEGS